MQFCLLNGEQKCQYKQRLLQILADNDTAFVPPLSQRTGTTQTDFQSAGGSICAYFDRMMEQNVLAVFLEGQVVGFVSYIENLTSDVIGEDTLPNLYISTLVLQPETRGMGITKKVYAYLFNELYPERNVFTRTWSTNTAHIKILNSFGFEEIKRIPNDRGAGVDTVYYGKKHTS